ncbi:uncharacterized protein LOC107269151 [Cephus cinctus]|uniref:Uncharacterized protein LOC107269151 n=1 Tax=Cephus cinctus TaxID=211228 RepID=A0AAJ7RM57_CEPCN|nr:uncharacterized protein LOC107269151 [Cephus cinctus]
MKNTAIPTSGCSVLTIALILLVSFSVEVYAKRGCSAFGHSCFGGHGKRSESNPLNAVLENVIANREIQDYDEPRSTNDYLFPDENQKAQDRQLRHSSDLIQPPQRPERYPLSFVINQWLASYRRANGADLETK